MLKIKRIYDLPSKGTITLLFAAKDVDRNNAVVLKEVIESGNQKSRRLFGGFGRDINKQKV